MTRDEHGTTRGTLFGEAAELYDSARPGYPDRLVTYVLTYAALEHPTAVEIGAGTGKATLPFAARGLPLLCLEPDPRMARVLRRNTAPYPKVRVEVTRFERWRSAGHRYGLLFAGASWHWLQPAHRWGLAHAALVPGGTIALFWNPHTVRNPRLRAVLEAVEAGRGITHPLVTTAPVAPLPLTVTVGTRAHHADASLMATALADCHRDGRFTDIRTCFFTDVQRFSTSRYLSYLASTSAYRLLPQDIRACALAAVARLLDAHGGEVEVLCRTDLLLARSC
ncbi:class I SAM-dependent methyltransferase [Streptomyces sp. NPDC003006]